MDRPCTLLLVEDEDVLRMLASQFLRAEGFQVREAVDGAEALALYAEEGPFDILLVDLNLPRVSGVEVCQRVRAIDPGQKILVCSAAIVEESERALRAAGVDQMMTKPYHPDDLVGRIRRLVAARPTPASASSLAPHRPMPMLAPVGAL